MTVTITKGDLLEQKVDAIVNTVNCVGVMGKGIALQFKRKWPSNFRDYQAACKSKLITPGRMFVHDAGALAKQPRYIINFRPKYIGRASLKSSSSMLGWRTWFGRSRHWTSGPLQFRHSAAVTVGLVGRR